MGITLNGEIARIFPITSQYENKNEMIRARYYRIKDWKLAGLDRQTYIDTGTRITQPLSVLGNIAPVGKLTENNMRGLSDFMSNA